MANQVGEAPGERTQYHGGESPQGLGRSKRAAPRMALGAFATLFAAISSASAQTPPPPPPGYGSQPPPGYYVEPAPQQQPAYGQPAYGPPGGYVQSGSYGMAPVGPKYLEWEEGDPIQPGYHPTTRIRKGLVIGGAVTFGSTYLLTAFSAAILVEAHTDNSQYSPLFAPAIGPFITIGTAHASGAGIFVLVLDGLVQTGSIAMFVAGLAAPRTALVRNDVGKAKITPIPMTFGRSSAGLGLVGSF
jgi:hypothetical protein